MLQNFGGTSFFPYLQYVYSLIKNKKFGMKRKSKLIIEIEDFILIFFSSISTDFYAKN